MAYFTAFRLSSRRENLTFSSQLRGVLTALRGGCPHFIHTLCGFHEHPCVLDATCAAPRHLPLRMSAIRRARTHFSTHACNPTCPDPFLYACLQSDVPGPISLRMSAIRSFLSMRNNAPVEHCIAEACILHRQIKLATEVTSIARRRIKPSYNKNNHV